MEALDRADLAKLCPPAPSRSRGPQTQRGRIPCGEGHVVPIFPPSFLREGPSQLPVEQAECGLRDLGRGNRPALPGTGSGSAAGEKSLTLVPLRELRVGARQHPGEQTSR